MTAADATRKGKVGDPFSSPWRRRLPLLPALIFTILVTQLPFLVSIYYSLTNLKDKTQSLIPEPTRFVGARRDSTNSQAACSPPNATSCSAIDAVSNLQRFASGTMTCDASFKVCKRISTPYIRSCHARSALCSSAAGRDGSSWPRALKAFLHSASWSVDTQ